MVPRYAPPKSTLPHRKAYRKRWAADTRVPSSRVSNSAMSPPPRALRGPPFFRHQPATSQREETWARPTALATPSRCWLHLPFPRLQGMHAPCSRVVHCPVSPRASSSHYGCEQCYTRRVKQSSRAKVQRLLEVPTVCTISLPLVGAA